MRQDRRGFTLVETMVVIGIFGLLAAISLPAFSNYVRTNRLSVSVERLAADLQLARATAIANNSVVRVTTADGGYRMTDLGTGNVLADRSFERGCSVAASASVRFFPWGQAESRSFAVAGSNGAERTVTVLPTGAVEVE